MTRADRALSRRLAASVLSRYPLEAAVRADEVDRLEDQINIAVAAHLGALGLEEESR